MAQTRLPPRNPRGDIGKPLAFTFAIFYHCCIGDVIDNGGGHQGT